YIGDLHGRLWKFLANSPGQPVLLSDFGKDQPIGEGVAELELAEGTGGTKFPHVFVTTGKDNRADPQKTGQFLIASLIDRQGDTDFSSPTTVQACVPGNPADPCLFVREQETNFRGTVHPETLFQDAAETRGAVFFVGTRFNPPGSLFAPPVPPFPC